MRYFVPKSLVYVSSNKVDYIYNWDLGDYIEFDHPHPFLDTLKRGDDFFESDDIEDINFLLKNNYIFLNYQNYQKFKSNLIQEHDDTLSKSLNLIILPAEQACNFSCVYCYEDHTIRKKMSEKEAKALLLFIKSECMVRSIQYLNISYFGGEPLLNKRFIFQFNKDLIEFSKELNFNFSSSMTTNGYLLDYKTVTRFHDLNLKSYQITIDGLQKEHDELRPLTNGRGSYNQIIRNLLAIKSSKLELLVDIRINFNEKHHSFDYQSKLIKDLVSKFGNDPRFRVRFRPIGDYSALNGKETVISALCGKNIANEAQIRFESIAIKNGLELSDISMLSQYGSYSCYAGKKNNFIIDSNLNVKMCTVALDQKINTVGLLSYDGILSLNENYSRWLKKHSKESCTTCFINTQCASSACTLVNIKENHPHCPSIVQYKKEWSERLIAFIERS